jgi:hypothetical protein
MGSRHGVPGTCKQRGEVEVHARGASLLSAVGGESTFWEGGSMAMPGVQRIPKEMVPAGTDLGAGLTPKGWGPLRGTAGPSSPAALPTQLSVLGLP